VFRDFFQSRFKDPENPNENRSFIHDLGDFTRTLVTEPDSANLPGLSFRESSSEEVVRNQLAVIYARVALKILRERSAPNVVSLRQIAGENLEITCQPSSGHHGSNHTKAVSTGSLSPAFDPRDGTITIKIRECPSSDVVMLNCTSSNDPDGSTTTILFYDNDEAIPLPAVGKSRKKPTDYVKINDPIDRFPHRLARMVRENLAQIESVDSDDDHCELALPLSKKEKKASQKQEQSLQAQATQARGILASRFMQAALIEAKSPLISEEVKPIAKVATEDLIGQKALVVYRLLTRYSELDLKDPSTASAALTLSMYGLFFDRELYTSFLKQGWSGVWRRDFNEIQKDLSRHKRPNPTVGSNRQETDGDYRSFFTELLSGRWKNLVSEDIKRAFGYDQNAEIGERNVVAVGLRIYTDLIINSLPEPYRTVVRNAIQDDIAETRMDAAPLSVKALRPLAKAVFNLGMQLFTAAENEHGQQERTPEHRVTLREFLLSIRAAGELTAHSILKIIDPTAVPQGSGTTMTNYFDKKMELTAEQVNRVIDYLKNKAPSIPPKFFDELATRP
jgi:hypothetical protein